MLAHHLIFVVIAVAVAAPVLAEIPVGVRVPAVVLEVVLGIVIGPHGLGLVQSSELVSTMQHGGMAAVRFMAGMEIDFGQIRGRPLSLALRGWAASIGLAFGAVAVLHRIPGVRAPLMVTTPRRWRAHSGRWGAHDVHEHGGGWLNPRSGGRSST
jgi:Kef-type K+ transport system membrane component KefB